MTQGASRTIRQAAAAIAVNVGPPFGWRLNRLTEALEYLRAGDHARAKLMAQRALLSADEIPSEERNEVCPRPFGAIMDAIRGLDGRGAPFAPIFNR